MYFPTNDPIADSYAFEREQEERARDLPVCAECGEPIVDEYAYFMSGEWICRDCMEEHRREVC